MLALDAGGSHTRAAVVDSGARCLGGGVSTSGNPTAVGAEAALAAFGAAAATALAGVDPVAVSRIVLAAAGERQLLTDEAVVATTLPEHPSPADVQVLRIPDALAAYHSAAVERAGVVLVAGTGAVAARFDRLVPQLVLDGVGWLLGDTGAGFWIGREVARAAAADLEHRGPGTALTGAVLDAFDLEPDVALELGRPAVLQPLLRAVYSQSPVRLARLATLAFESKDDDVARRILGEAEHALAGLVRQVREGYAELPVVLGGSVVTRGFWERGETGPLAEALRGADVRLARDGLAGAAVVGLLSTGVDLTPDDLTGLAADISAASAA